MRAKLSSRPPSTVPSQAERGETEPRAPLTPRAPLEGVAPGRPTFPALRALRAKKQASATDLVVSTGAPNPVHGSLVAEPSVAVNGPVALMTWNWYAAVTTNGGGSFSYLDPYQDKAYGGFCCDQSAYYDPSRDLYIWIQMYLPDASGNNAIRLLVAKGPVQLANGTFSSWDLTPQQLGAPSGVFYDNPKVSSSDNFLYLEVSSYSATSFVRSTVLRLALDDLAAGGALPYDYFLPGRFSPGFTEGARGTMYFASHLTTGTLRLYSWPESVGSSGITNVDVPHHPYPRSLPYSCPRSGGSASSDWCQRPAVGNPGHYAHDDRIMGGWVANGIIGFAWDASQGQGGLGSFPYPYVHVVRINEATKTLIDEPILWNDKFAFAYAALAPNASGDLGGTVMWGGGSSYENCGLLVHDGYRARPAFWEFRGQAFSDSDPNEPEGGDYLAARPDPANPSRWSGTCYALHGGGVGSNMRPYYYSFARQAPAVSLAVSTSGSGTGSVASLPSGISCGQVCVESFAHDASVALIATPAGGSAFAGWSGDCSGQICRLTMSTPHSVQATFVKLEPLSVAKAGSGSGRVGSSPAGIDCGSACSASFPQGASVSLSAAADPGSDFTGWSGDCSGTGGCLLSMSSAHSVTATFAAVCVVPRLVGLGQARAKAAIRTARCSVGRTKKVYSKRRKGLVTSQSPAAGKHVPQGASVNLVVSRGKKRCIVPRVLGLTLAGAKKVLRKAHCSVGRVSRRYSASPKGHVVRQKPHPGVHRPAGSPVRLVLSRGRRPR